MTTALSVFTDLKEKFFSYYDTAFGLADPSVQAERRELLDLDGVVYRRPWLEILPEYESSGVSFERSCGEAGFTSDLSSFARLGLIPYKQLYLHQHQALCAAGKGKNIVLTAGTGSGKTEGMFLPVLASLLKESIHWGKTDPNLSNGRWWNLQGQFQPQRKFETGRTAAVRTIVLYPMNALVEDQLLRLRKTLDGPLARKWLASNRNGHKFYFGRYTGATPVPGEPGDARRIPELINYLQTAERVANQVGLDESKRYYTPSIDGAEMLSRWDMLANPPDILVTNYSMLNIMLLREQEALLFDKTKEWLDESSEHVFTLVVDELHLYRGTPGTEVAYLIRNLLKRLNLQGRMNQVRFIASSASLEAGRDGQFLEGFFGVDSTTFEVIAGKPSGPKTTTSNLSPIASRLINLSANYSTDLSQAPFNQDNILDALLNVSTEEGRVVARDAEDLQARLFPDLGIIEGNKALDGLLMALELGLAEPVRLRAHLFFRNIQGLWACSDPDCNKVKPEYRSQERKVGHLYTKPVHLCSCGSRVLELLFCRTCGDLFLGGFRSPDAGIGAHSTMLVPDSPELELVPDQTEIGRTGGNYIVYWPRLDLGIKKSWERQPYNFSFREAKFDPKSGRLVNDKFSQTGWSFHVSPKKGTPIGLEPSPENVTAFPNKCPNCGDNWASKRNPSGTDYLKASSPIGSMRTGFEKISQVLTDGILRNLGEPRKLVVFSDSRQDAAKLSAGLEKRHYQDAVRQLLVYNLEELGRSDLAPFERVENGSSNPNDILAAQRFEDKFPSEALAISRYLQGKATAFQIAQAEEARLRLAKPEVSISLLASRVEDGLLSLGINPGGPDYSLQENDTWSSAYTWGVHPHNLSSSALTNNLRDLILRINDSLLKECERAIFAGSGGDFESIGLASSTIKLPTGLVIPGLSELEAGEVLSSSCRILGLRRRIQTRYWGRLKPPGFLVKYWMGVCLLHKIPLDTLQNAICNAWADVVQDFLLDPSQVILISPKTQSWVCGRCRRQHLQGSAGVCTNCFSNLPSPDNLHIYQANYFAQLARETGLPFRLHCEELTGQTDRDVSQSRQRWFQGIDIMDENKLVKEIDLLSVTTTMEAGVDIGELKAVILANMPPQRFNYQQRVGRAGRRREALSLALTICRGRSHDDFYFNNPGKITGDLPDPPYLDLKQREIVQRVLAAEVLRLAFQSIRGGTADLELGDNVHGQFGTARDWPKHGLLITEWILGNLSTIYEVADALLAKTQPKLMSERSTLIGYIQEEFVPQITKFSKEPSASSDLSQRLAEKGVLPMFGFPTRVRHLFHKDPSRQTTYPWPPRGVVDRDLSIAISQFAPGADVIKDKQILTPVGLGSWYPGPWKVVSDPNPMGLTKTITVCRVCLYIEPNLKTALSCPVCGEIEQFHNLEIVQPLGFRTDFAKPKDFDGKFEMASRSLTPRVTPDNSTLVTEYVSNAIIQSGKGDIYTINDRGGRDFTFASAENWEGRVCLDLINDPSQSFDLKLPTPILGTERRVALGDIQVSDLLLVSISKIPNGVDLDPYSTNADGFRRLEVARKAAWFSLGFMLREAAKEVLQTQSKELRVGVRMRPTPQSTSIEVFLADSLENGAGYATQLGKKDVFEKVLYTLKEYLKELAQGLHASCETSCYECLRDFHNMAYHPSLDWRLGRDMVSLLRGGELSVNEWFEDEHRRAQLFVAGFGGEVKQFGPMWGVVSNNKALLVTHPLENQHDHKSARIMEALTAGNKLSFGANFERPILFADSFNLLRRPGVIAIDFDF